MSNEASLPQDLSSINCSNVTNIDKNRSLAVKAKILINNLQVMRQSFEKYSATYETSIGKRTKKKINSAFKDSFAVCTKLSEDILNMSSSKSAVNYLDQRLTADKNLNDQILTVREKHATKSPNKQPSLKLLDDLMSVSNQLTNNKEEKTPSKASTPTDNLRSSRRKLPIEIVYPSVQQNKDNTIKFDISPDAIFTFPIPLHDSEQQIYTVGEFLDHLKLYSFKNYTGLMQFMKEKGYIVFSERTFFRKLREYKESMLKESVSLGTDQIVMKKGCPSIMKLEDVTVMNKKVKQNLSLDFLYTVF